MSANKHIVRKQPTTAAGGMELLDANSSRVALAIQNAGAVRCHLDSSTAVSTASPYLEPGEWLTEDGEGVSLDAWWGLAASGTADLRIIEVF